MSTRVTRGSVARSTAAVLATSKNENLPQQSSSLPVRFPVEKKKKAALLEKEKSKVKLETPGVKREAMSPKKANLTVNPESSAVVTPANTGRKRKRAAQTKVEEDPHELPHNLGRLPVLSGPVLSGSGGVKLEEPSPKKRNTKATTTKKVLVKPTEQATATDAPEGTPVKKSRTRTANPYGLTPGVTPFPDWPHPTVAECHEVNELLSKVHGVQAAPTTIPKPSLTVSGCGEVPSILDAMIRTRLSAATAGSNSNLAIEGLAERFGILQEGIGKGSIDWDAVRRADVKDVFTAIKAGGLGETKSADIKAILELVHSENQARCEALIKAEQIDADAAPKGAENETPAERFAEIVRAKENVLSLDHLHALENNDAMHALVKYPGIGVKTASCVMLFCMRRPSFAVDTHVFRLLKWLKWVPPGVKNEIAAFKHIEVRVPNELKYPLHQLFIKHGKTCGRCKAATGETNVDWDKGCAIDHLLTRTGPRKGGVDALSGKKALVKPVGGTEKKTRKDAVTKALGKTVAGKKVTGKQMAGKKVTKKKVAGEKVAGKSVTRKKVAGKKVAVEAGKKKRPSISDEEEEDDQSTLSDPPDEEEHEEHPDKKIKGKQDAAKPGGGKKQTSGDVEDDDLSVLSDLPEEAEDDLSELSDISEKEEVD
ncbi:hypothetical protein MMC29_005824 [Sticta canariensis]|nr:hypothetical protein [Sticta canariensis]